MKTLTYKTHVTNQAALKRELEELAPGKLLVFVASGGVVVRADDSVDEQIIADIVKSNSASA